MTGSAGMIGSNGIDFGIRPKSNELDITDINSINFYVSKLGSISAIIHLAATNLRESEENPKKAINVNILGTINMLSIAKRYDVKFILISSGAVFSSQHDRDIIFDEESIPNPNCMYGITKYASEQVALLYDKTIVIRTGWLFGSIAEKCQYKFVETTIMNLQMNKIVNGSSNFYGSPVYLPDFIHQVRNIILYYSTYKIHHVVNSNYGSGFDISLEIAKIMNKPASLIVSTDSSNVPNAMVFRSMTEKLVSRYSFNILSPWQDALNEYISKNMEFIAQSMEFKHKTWD